ncbi:MULTISPECIES: GlxA family transcriptional regulator [unclassified Streptomyces]|uniref:GlxA family transcriptional regulator n=1 Tax=unclassified Streptomyces TaxID=2593676 RepID=UPI0005EBFC01|nr:MULTISPECIES: helix-turn-helix domain-containing protein [unclassified Streptomyces]APU38702.1 AraC family transcriptional regulator [Streptomyces sp. TN58]
MSLHRVVCLLLPPQSTFELACAAEVFGLNRPGLPTRYTLEVCTEQPGPLPTSGGYDMAVTHGLSALERAQTVLIPGWAQRASTPSPCTVDALRRAHRRGARIVALCSAAFLLAEAGLLEGRRATTHWRMADELAARHPGIQVEPDVLYIDLGDVATSAGGAAGIDLLLHLIRTDQGAAYATHVARHMVMPPHREGGQLQYATLPRSERTPDSLAPVLDWAAERLHEPLSVDDLAAFGAVSTRTLARRFAEQLGTSPGNWLLRQRVMAARTLLEETDLSVEAIAARTGLSSAANLRRRFHTLVHTTPAAYRRSFRHDGAGTRSGGSASSPA